MQHTPTTVPRTADSPKKSADACLFCFPGVMACSKLSPSLRNSVAVRCRLPLGEPEPGLILKGDGDGHEKNSLVGNGAGNDHGFGSCGGYAGQGRESATAGAVRSLGYRVRQ